MKILVTGGAGFIGSNYILEGIKSENEIVCLDKLTYAGNISTLSCVMDSPLFQFVQGDIADRDLVFQLFEKERFDAVVNFAAESHVDRSIVSSSEFVRTNIVGTQVLLDAALQYQVRFHQVSTDEVYGQLPLDDGDSAFTEKSPLNPSSPYSASKAGADLLCIAYYKTHGLFVTVSRCSNNYGPYQFPEKFIPVMIIKALHDEKLPIYGTGRNVRDWIHVHDHNRAINLILDKGKPGEVYNVGACCQRNNLSLAKDILSIMGKSHSLLSFVEDRKGHDLRYAIDPSKIESELGFQSSIDFSQGLEDTVKWYLDNQDWWGPLNE